MNDPVSLLKRLWRPDRLFAAAAVLFVLAMFPLAWLAMLLQSRTMAGLLPGLLIAAAAAAVLGLVFSVIYAVLRRDWRILIPALVCVAVLGWLALTMP